MANETDEIEKIMSEIEELQKDMAPKAPASPGASLAAAASAAASATASADSAHSSTISGVEEDILREIQANAQNESDAGLEDTLANLKQEEASGGMLAETSQTEETEETMSYPNSNGDGTLSLTLTGNMTLKLKYEFEGQEVTISFVDQALRVQMTDGTEFKVPVTRSQSRASRGSASPSNIKPFKKAV